jgi:hypothetical protein
MKKYRAVYRIMLLVASLFVILFGLSACKCSPGDELSSSTTTPTAKVTPTPLTMLSIIGGKVLVMKPGDTKWVSGVVGMTLGVDYKIKTEAGGHATITFFEGSTIELEGVTEISLSELSLDGTTSQISISQKIGKTVSQVKKLIDPASDFEIETASAIAAVRGTAFYVSVERNGTTVVGNMEGQVSVTANGVEVMLSEGTRTTVLPGHSPGQPEPDVTPASQGMATVSPR